MAIYKDGKKVVAVYWDGMAVRSIYQDGQLIFGGEKKYITDSAKLWVDGIWNNGMGDHKSDLTAWVDLSGNCDPTPLLSANTVGDDYIDSNGTANGLLTVPTVAPINITENLTVECVVLCYPTSLNNVVFFGRNHTNSYYANSARGSGEFGMWLGNTNRKIGIAENNELFQFSLTLSPDETKAFKNGEAVETWSNGKTLSSTTTQLNIFGCKNNKTYFQGRIYALRIHNRILSDEELKHNYELDKERFGIGGTA